MEGVPIFYFLFFQLFLCVFYFSIFILFFTIFSIFAVDGVFSKFAVDGLSADGRQKKWEKALFPC